jgi:hypothetical protein
MAKFAILAFFACLLGVAHGDPATKPAGPSDGSSKAAVFYKTGTNTIEDFASVASPCSFDVVNSGKSYFMLVFDRDKNATYTPNIVRLGPGERKTVSMSITPGVSSFAMSYAVTLADAPFKTHSNRYRAYNDGETVLCVPVDAASYASMQTRMKNILDDSKTLVTDPKMPGETYIYTPGPVYRAAGIFARDFLYQLEGSGRSTVTADEVKRAVDFMILKQLPENRRVGPFTFPKGAIADHIYPDGRYAWGPGVYYGDVNGHFQRPSLDEAMCFITLAWHYGYKADWNADWQKWFHANVQHFADAWNSVPRNPKSGLVTQWTTPNHLGASGIAETDGGCVMWGFHDSYALPGDDLGTSVLACNAARALADMHEHADDAAATKQWSDTADAMRDAIRSAFNPEGYLPWGIGENAPTMASPDITGYAVWSGILTDAQADQASDWFAKCYVADRAAGGAADLFQMTPGLRGAVRMARKADDRYPGSHIWPHVSAPHWENLAFGYNAYQDGGYWYYMSLGIATTLWRNHPMEAKEWVGNAYHDLAAADEHHPYERFDGVKPDNDRYNASVGSLFGMGMPAESATIAVTVSPRK